MTLCISVLLSLILGPEIDIPYMKNNSVNHKKVRLSLVESVQCVDTAV